jgi:hypothetical protein
MEQTMPPGLDKLKHIVVLMMENRSFDHMVGFLKRENPSIRGIVGADYSNPSTAGARLQVTDGAQEDIRGSDIVLKNDAPADGDDSLEGNETYMDGFEPVQRGTVGDMTAGLPLGPWTEKLAERLKAQLEVVWQENGLTGTELEERRRAVETAYAAKIAAGELYYPYVPYPYFEWYSDNSRVVLELDPDRITVIRPETPPTEKSSQELAQDRKKRAKAFGGFMTGMVRDLSEENRQKGGDGNVTGIVIG